MQRSIYLLSIAVLLSAAPYQAAAQNWATQMFADTSHDFGTVARGAKTEHVFVFTNRLSQEVRIRGVRVSCGCTSTQVETYTVGSGQQGTIRAILNTRSFKGAVSSTITVAFDHPAYAEAQLHVRGYVRRDVVFEPSCADFGSVPQGTARECHVDLQYAGRSDWQITAIRSPERYVTVRATQTRRTAGRVGYDLLVRLADDAPPGFLNTEVTLETNDFRMRTVPLAVTGQVVPALTVSPALLFLGSVAAGTEKQSRLVVRGTQPFRVTAITCSDPRLEFEISQERKTLHFVPLTFRAGSDAGEVHVKVRIETDLLDGRTAEIAASGTVVP
jgi:hypothetical protein